MSHLLALFPGQGSQSAGMAEYLWEYPVARDTFAEAGDILGWDIGELCRHGSMDELSRTDRTQPALLTCSAAAWRVLAQRGVSLSVAAGHSLGEFSALVAAGWVAFADALQVVEERAVAMLQCGEERPGAMAAIIGLDGAAVEQLLASLSDVWLANYNSPSQVVISGHPDAVEEAGTLALAAGAKRAVRLPVSGAFHTPFMAGAVPRLRQALSRVTFREGEGRFFSTTESRFPGTSELVDILAEQITHPVRFNPSMQFLLAQPQAPRRGLEVGPGGVLAGLLKRIAPDFPVQTTADEQSLQRAAAGTEDEEAS
jgi:[acyl-carrier-protein] S-malonyltransferase